MDDSAVDGDLVLINACLLGTLVLDLPLSQRKCKSQTGHISQCKYFVPGLPPVRYEPSLFPTRAAVRCGPLLSGFHLNKCVLLRTVSEILDYEEISRFEQAALQLLVIFGHAQSGFSTLRSLS